MRKGANFRSWFLVFFLFSFSFFYKWLYWRRSSPLSLGDLYFYQGLAQAFLERDWAHFWHFHFYPVYPILMALFHRISGSDLVSSARYLNLIFDSLSLVLIYLIGKNIYSVRVGLFASLFWSCSWFKLYGDPEPVYVFFILVGFFLMFRNSLGLRNYLFAFALASFASLIKSEAMLFLFFFSLMYLIQGVDFLRRKFYALLLAGAIYLAFSSPLWIKYYQATGRFNPNPKSRTLFFIHNYKGSYQGNLYGLREDENGLYSYAQRIYIEGDKRPISASLFSYLKGNYKLFVISYLDKLNFVLEKDLSFFLLRIFPAAPLLFLLSWVRRRRDYNLKEVWLWFWALSVLFAISLYDVWERFFYPFFPVLVLISGKGLEQIMLWFESRIQKFPSRRVFLQSLKWFIVCFFLLWFLVYHLVGLSRTKPDQSLVRKFTAKAKLASELKKTIDPGAKIMCRGFPEPISYFLDLPFYQMVVLPLAGERAILIYAQEASVKYLFFEEDDLKRNPYLERWLFGEISAEGLRRVRYLPRALRGEWYPYAFYELEPKRGG